LRESQDWCAIYQGITNYSIVHQCNFSFHTSNISSIVSINVIYHYIYKSQFYSRNFWHCFHDFVHTIKIYMSQQLDTVIVLKYWQVRYIFTDIRRILYYVVLLLSECVDILWGFREGKIAKTHLHHRGVFIYPLTSTFVSINHLHVTHIFMYPLPLHNFDRLMWFLFDIQHCSWRFTLA
jgi:hypothetical protein